MLTWLYFYIFLQDFVYMSVINTDFKMDPACSHLLYDSLLLLYVVSLQYIQNLFAWPKSIHFGRYDFYEVSLFYTYICQTFTYS